MNGHDKNIIVNKGLVLLDQGRYKDAAKIFKDGLSMDPEDGYLLYYLAVSQYHVKDQRGEALRTINEAIKREHGRPEFYQVRALVLADTGKIKEAIDAIDTALRIDAEYAEAHAAKGYIYGSEGKWRESEKCARQALSIDADNKFAGNVLAQALSMQNRLDEGVHLTSDMLAKDPDNCVSHSNAGWVYLHKKDYGKAQIHFKEALRLDPNFEPARSGMLEALKARSLVYRLYLQYCIFMARQTRAVRFSIIFGIYLASRLVSSNFNAIFQGPWVAAGCAVMVLFYTFFFWSWLAGGIGNLLVMKDKMARYALNMSERLDAIFVGGGLFLGIFSLSAGLLLGAMPAIIFGAAVILSTIPFSVTFVNKKKIGKVLYGSMGVYIVFVGALMAVGSVLYGKDIPPVLVTVAETAFIPFVLSMWLAAFGLFRK